MTRLFLNFAFALALFGTLTTFAGKASAQPSWSSPGECYTDEGHKGFRPCGNGGN